MTTPRPILVVANVLVSERDELLMGLRSDCMLWEVPGGKVDDETAVEAARRELKEETGIIGKGEPVCLGFVEVVLRGQRFFVVFYQWKEWDGFPRRMEEDKCLQYRWVPFGEFPAPENVTVGTQAFREGIFPALTERWYGEDTSEVYGFADEQEQVDA